MKNEGKIFRLVVQEENKKYLPLYRKNINLGKKLYMQKIFRRKFRLRTKHVYEETETTVRCYHQIVVRNTRNNLTVVESKPVVGRGRCLKIWLMRFRLNQNYRNCYLTFQQVTYL